MGWLRKIFLPQTREPLTAQCKKGLSLGKAGGGSVLSETGEDRQLSRDGMCLELGKSIQVGNDSKIDLPTISQSGAVRGPWRVQRIWKGNKKPISSYSKEIRRVCILKSFLLFFLTTSSFPLLRIKPRAACMPGECSGPALHPYSKAVFFLLKLSTKFSCTHYLMNS